MCPRMAFLIIVFFPMSSTACFLRDKRICCICFDPTLSTPTMKHFGYSSKSCTNFMK
uniref:U18-Saltitoxin-Pre1a_1 n=1 Tax=Phidippus regius TaxID=1905328 RepID=A0A482Z8G6_9ARAC